MSGLAITTFGAFAITFMMVMYSLERRHPGFVLAFAIGCLLSRPTVSCPAPGLLVSWK